MTYVNNNNNNNNNDNDNDNNSSGSNSSSSSSSSSSNNNNNNNNENNNNNDDNNIPAVLFDLRCGGSDSSSTGNFSSWVENFEGKFTEPSFLHRLEKISLDQTD
ncbi:hypothetical protein V1477_017894 [Vespula maculifrons]|uniref:Uncharacterized protein n=1 Tax=Vespula maculifrons TaxID=7453 RepID=A0ABD2B1B9_VESMC